MSGTTDLAWIQTTFSSLTNIVALTPGGQKLVFGADRLEERLSNKKVIFMPGVDPQGMDGDETYLDGGILVTQEDLDYYDRVDRVANCERTRIRFPETFARLFPNHPLDQPYTG